MNIDKIEFVPSINNLKAGKSSIEDRLRESLEKCVNIKSVQMHRILFFITAINL